MIASRYYKKDAIELYFLPSHIKLLIWGGFMLCLSIIVMFMCYMIDNITLQLFPLNLKNCLYDVTRDLTVLFFVGTMVITILSIVVYKKTSEETRIINMIKKSLFCPKFGNPLNLKDGQKLPKIECISNDFGVYTLSIYAGSVSIELLEGISCIISASLNDKFEKYAVTSVVVDMSFNKVSYKIEDVTVDRSIYADCINDVIPIGNTKLVIQKGTYIDMTTSGSILVAGKTRSGKTTGIISILLQVLLQGRDNYGSEIIIIDPKQAELSRLPCVVSFDENGKLTKVIASLKQFVALIKERQQVLNDLSVKKGDAQKWWDVGMKPSFVFIDEYIALRCMLPKKATKDNPDYCVATFDALLKRIITMGASAGCFAIISIAEASVDEGGLPSMLKAAMTTKVLFKPTLVEARLLWSSEKLEALNSTQSFVAGDAWFSSPDGINDNVSLVHFPVLKFGVYKTLGELLDEYYQ